MLNENGVSSLSFAPVAMSKDQRNAGNPVESVAFNLGGVAAAIGGVLTLAILLNVYSNMTNTENDETQQNSQSTVEEVIE